MTQKKRPNKRVPKHIQEELEEYQEIKDIKGDFNFKDIKFKKSFKNKKQKELYEKIISNRIVFVKGPAGTGKTIISLMAALECILNETMKINKISLTIPIVEVSKSLGALPGDEKEKTAVYFSHFYDNLEKILGKYVSDKLKNSGLITETIINYIRGNTFGTYVNGEPIGAVCILDEAQNTTVNEIKTFISRMGENTKLIICGDSEQVDLKLGKNEINGFDFCFERMRDINLVEFIEFTEDDIVREILLIEIMKRFKLTV